MNIFDISKKVLLKINNDNLLFNVALKVVFKNNNVDPSWRSNITALVGCELRHQLIFDNLISRFLGEVPFEDTVYLRFYLANSLFLKRFDSEEILKLSNKVIDSLKVEELLKFVSTTKEIIPDQLDKASPEFLSYRFNCPAWIIRMWQKQYGKGLVFKVLKANYHQSTPTLRVDTNQISTEDVLGQNPDLGKTLVNDIVAYNGRGNVKNLEPYSSGKIFFMKMATKYILDRLNIEPFKNIAVYSDVPNNIYLDLLVRLQFQLNLDLIINNIQSYVDAKNNIERHKLDKVKIYNTSYENLITCISNPVDVFICLPNSSAFDLLRSTPDYFIRIKQDKLDTFIAEQIATLNEAANYINFNGDLVYMVPTLNKKESINVIGNFLSNHKDFTLIEEKQFFPFESFDSCLYYAILRKEKEQDD